MDCKSIIKRREILWTQMAFRGKKSAEGRVELLIGSGSVKVAVCDAVEEGEVRCAVLFRCCFSILYFSCGLSISRINTSCVYDCWKITEGEKRTGKGCPTGVRGEMAVLQKLNAQRH